MLNVSIEKLKKSDKLHIVDVFIAFAAIEIIVKIV
ncbi:MAG: hypothetical protein RL535_457 [Pseudomonadota bacterium]|jgi:hypothetical protein